MSEPTMDDWNRTLDRLYSAEAEVQRLGAEVTRLVLVQSEVVRKAVEPLEAQIAELKHELGMRELQYWSKP